MSSLSSTTAARVLGSTSSEQSYLVKSGAAEFQYLKAFILFAPLVVFLAIGVALITVAQTTTYSCLSQTASCTCSVDSDCEGCPGSTPSSCQNGQKYQLQGVGYSFVVAVAIGIGLMIFFRQRIIAWLRGYERAQ